MSIKNEIIFISILFGVAIFLFIMFWVALINNSAQKHTRYAKQNPDDWLLHDFSNKLYGAFFGNKSPIEACVKLGIKIENYIKNCELIGEPPKEKKLVINYIYAVLIFCVCVIFAILFNPLFLSVGLIIFFVLIQNEIGRVEKKAKFMRNEIKNDLPQFLDLLSTELAVGMPVEIALVIISEKYDCLLSKEFLYTLNDVKLGGISWQTALEKVALKYNVDILSDFVLDICVAYTKGISIFESVERKAKEIKQKHFLDLKESAGKTENTILIPIALLQFIPMLIFIILPALISVKGL